MKEEIVIPAWKVASSNTAIKIFNFFPSLLSTIYLSLVILYQVAWSSIYIFNLKDKFFSWVVEFTHSSFFVEIVFILVFFFLVFILFTPIAEGGLVALIHRIYQNDDQKNVAAFGIGAWLKHFLPVFEANNIAAPFKLLSIITFWLFLVRLFGMPYLTFISIGIGLYFICAMVVNVFLAYTRFFIVLEKKKAFDAIIASTNMALDNIGITVRLYLTLILVYVRTILTVSAFIIFPFLISGVLTYVTIVSIQFLFIGILVMLLVGFILFIAHINSVLEIFVETLWYRAYVENKNSESVWVFHG